MFLGGNCSVLLGGSSISFDLGRHCHGERDNDSANVISATLSSANGFKLGHFLFLCMQMCALYYYESNESKLKGLEVLEVAFFP